jgi:Leucine-rich repeat (LRR) protein
LDLSHNFLTSIAFIEGLPSLHVLDVSYNPICDDGFSVGFQLRRLAQLNVSGTKLTTTKALTFAPFLEKCDFKRTRVSDIWSFIKSQKRVTELDLRETEATKGLYFDLNDYASIDQYDRRFPTNADRRRQYRSRVLAIHPRIVKLDGIPTGVATHTVSHSESRHRTEFSTQHTAEEIRSRVQRNAVLTNEDIGLIERESRRSNRQSRQWVYDVCSQAIFAYARKPLAQAKVLTSETIEFRILQAFLASKMSAKIRLLSAVRKNNPAAFLQMEQRLRWITLVVDDGVNSQSVFESGVTGPIIVADHMRHILARLDKAGDAIFLVCAFDNGQTAVADGSLQMDCDSVLFRANGMPFFRVLNTSRVLPLYLVRLALHADLIPPARPD